MTEVHRYKVVKMLSEDGNRISYDPHGPEVVVASAFDQIKADNTAALRGATDLAMAIWRRCYAKDSPNFQPFEKASSVIGQIDNMAAGLMSDLEKLRAEVAGLKTGYEAYERVNAELKAEVEALRKDADRWKFVRNPVGSGSPFAIWSERTNLFLGRFADEAIDAAMGKGELS